MSAEIIMCVDGEEFSYGRYHFETNDQKRRVNELAMNIASERSVYTYVKELD